MSEGSGGKAPKDKPRPGLRRRARESVRHTARALGLVWQTSRALPVALGFLTLLAAAIPAASAWTNKLVLDGVLQAIRSGLADDRNLVILFVLVQGGLMLLNAGAQRGLAAGQTLLRLRFGRRITRMILEKALQMRLRHFENAEMHNTMLQARQDAGSRPANLVTRIFTLARYAVGFAIYAVLVARFSVWAVLIVSASALPLFFVETRYSGKGYQLAKSKTPELRERGYLESLMTKLETAKERLHFGIGSMLLGRHQELADDIYRKDRSLQVRRSVWGFLVVALGYVGLYGVHIWIVLETLDGRRTVGEMAMYVALIRQTQTAVTTGLTAVAGMYEDSLFIANLYRYLDIETPPEPGEAAEGPDPEDGLRVEDVTFTYPGGKKPVIHDVSLHVPPGTRLGLVGENGSGKTTLVKLLMRLYEPDSGRILLDGLDLREWDIERLRRRVAVIFQDFVRFKLTIGDNIGAGDIDAFDDEKRWAEAARLATADRFIEKLPDGYRTRLGKAFAGGHELSGGEWQKVALARAFMRRGADILVLDEPTAAMDARAEAEIFEQARTAAKDHTVVLISHRLSAVRPVDHILVMAGGRIVERGSHDELMEAGGRYAHMFRLQAEAYR